GQPGAAIRSLGDPDEGDGGRAIPRVHQLERELGGPGTREAVLDRGIVGSVPSHFRTPPEPGEGVTAPDSPVAPRMDPLLALSEPRLDELGVLEGEPCPHAVVDRCGPRDPEGTMEARGQPRIHSLDR